jgi:preprotein translocase subunit SecF
MLQILKKTNIDFVGKRYYAFGISAVLVILGIIAIVAMLMGKANLGIDFGGGTLLEGNFDKPVDIGTLRSAMSREGYTDALIQSLAREKPNFYTIRVKTGAEEVVTKTSAHILSILAKEFPDNKFNMDSVDGIGPAVGKTLQHQTQIAVLIAIIGILIYIWIRFDFRFGVAATIATFHDVLAVLGIFFILHREITLLFVTALLTLCGYSLTDTVVVYDRIRENLKLFRKKGDFNSTINASINEVLNRTLNTSILAFIPVAILFFVGGPVVHDFSLAMMFGVIEGTYSSWYVAASIAVEWEKRSPRRFK